MTEQTTLEAVETVLRDATEYLPLEQISRLAKVEDSIAKSALKALANAGQIDHIPGAGRNPTRYGWLHTAGGVGPGILAFQSSPAAVDPLVTATEPSVEQMLIDAQKSEPWDVPFGDLVSSAGYLVRVSKRKPRIVRDVNHAVSLALAARRNGASHAKVFELVPVGTARRVAEFDPE